MSLKIRLARAGTKKRPYYHIVLADARSPRDGRFIEKIGSYDPMLADDSKRVVLNASRRKRIAAGSGTEVSDVNKLMKQHRQMADMMKKVSKGGLGSLAGMFGGKMGGMMPGLGSMPDPSTMDPRELERMAREMGIDPASIPQAPAAAPKDISQKLPTDVGQLLKSGSGLPGLGGTNRFPGLPGLSGGFVPKKK